MKMKNLVLSLTILATTLSATSSFAGCLDNVPKSQNELKRELFRAKMEHSIALDNRAMYEDLAKSANDRKNLADIVAVTGLLPLAGIGAISLGVTGIMSSLPRFIGAVAIVAAEGTAETVSIVSYFKGLKAGKYDLPDTASIAAGACSYEQMQRNLSDKQSAIIDDKFDGSIIHTIQDHVTFGRVSSKATFRLFELAHLKALLAEEKLKELNAIKLQ